MLYNFMRENNTIHIFYIIPVNLFTVNTGGWLTRLKTRVEDTRLQGLDTFLFYHTR